MLRDAKTHTRSPKYKVPRPVKPHDSCSFEKFALSEQKEADVNYLIENTFISDLQWNFYSTLRSPVSETTAKFARKCIEPFLVPETEKLTVVPKIIEPEQLYSPISGKTRPRWIYSESDHEIPNDDANFAFSS